MPRLLCEGKSLTELLARVRDEHGAGVKIVQADRVRTKGLGGFFARESYAVTIEVDEPDAVPDLTAADFAALMATPSARPVENPGTLLDLAAAIDAAEAAEAGVVLGTAPMHATVASPPKVMTAGPRIGTVPLPSLSTSTPGFAAILARLTAIDDVTPEPPQGLTTPGVEPTVHKPEAASWERLRDVLAEIAPGVDLGSGAPLVLVLTAPVAEVTAPAIPRQGRHRRSLVPSSD